MNMPLDQWNGSAATKALHEDLRRFDSENKVAQRSAHRLNMAVLVISALALAAAVAQLFK